MQKSLTAIAISLGFTAASPTLADGIYYGFGLGFASAESEQGGGGVGFSELESAMLGVTTGYKWNVNSGFAALEMDADLSFGQETENTVTGFACSSGATGAYFCTHDATIRLRGIYGAPVGNGWSIFGALGYGFVSGTGAISPATTAKAITGGVTAGLGIQKQIGGGTLRVEFIHDNFSSGVKKADAGGFLYTPTWEANTLKATYLINF
ncbi:hypothetical protein SAMN05444000_1113 [Shimia gijangensis]|uniref:Outer membrane protein beta-barrel domain-containing protein n=1 Tax=Shimia gijangensis TaxID=1470563 RepID=A0A1M6KVJ2_9RHOB|nr:hypothetical protein [Shimia gijangensis]SHJ62910.1 hypothetical protein SAMN05444000_1113 [Shimia gijangensis]